ncbi:MAG TPA: hypothetical protein VI702_04055 [Nitrospiria bacterium]
MKRILLIALLLLAGCGGPWLRVGGPYTADDFNVKVDFPEKWMRMNTNDYLLVTRDGVLLQYILIETMRVDDALKHTKKKFKRGMLPQEAAEVILDNKTSNSEVLNFHLVENSPARIGGLPGFKAVYTFKDKDGLKVKGIYYGFLLKDQFYGVSYSAASRYYYEKDLKTFEKVFKSFKLIKAA